MLWFSKYVQVPIWFITYIVTDVIQLGMMPCLPGVITEMIANEIEKIKISLTNHLYEDNNGINDRGSAEGFLRYLQLRPLRCSVWRLLPVDLTLPVSLLSLCTTYLIVLIQFSDLY
ncbi:uncharacterized protein LOC119694612 [Plutella xylostella]|uniref:uncharacterized protein LOC119694612 n=1 Tax=Plutella xylostella TaxID=51655 RepID=UPI002032247B|nr:uncharacterized protein LOC119694612 [Plutella xylostella]